MTTKSERPPLTRAEGEALRHDYATTDMTIAEILDKYGVGQNAAYRWIDGGPRVNGEPMLPPLARRSPLRRTRTDREKLVARLWRAASTQVKTLENRLNNSPEPDERDARTMAVLVKTLHDLDGLNGDKAKSRPKRGAEAAPDPKADDPSKGDGGKDDPREIDEFRRELARRIAALDGGGEEDAGGRA